MNDLWLPGYEPAVSVIQPFAGAYTPQTPMLSLPVRLTAGTTVTDIISHLDHGTLRLLAISGTRDKDGAPVIYVAGEVPWRDATIAGGSRAKTDYEQRDVDRFLSVVLRTSRPVWRIEPGSDPPDVIATVGSHKLRIETSQLFLPSPVSSRATVPVIANDFERIVDYLVANSARLKGRLRAHQGHQIFLFFAADQEMAGGPPPRPQDTNGINPVIELLTTAKPQPFLGRPGRTPSHLPESAVQYNDDRTVGASWLRCSEPTLQSTLWRVLGFDLGLAYTREVTRDNVRQELRRLIDQHDKTPTDLLLLTIGTPTRSGWIYPSGGAVASLLARDPDPTAGHIPRHIRCIALNDTLTNSGQGGVVRCLYGEVPELGLAAAPLAR